MRLLTLTLLCAAPLFLTGCDFGDEDPQDPPDTTPDGGTPPDGGSPDDPFAREMVSAHNAVRLSATPAPNPPLPVLTWSTQAARTARAWVDKCEYRHNPNRGNLGENIAASTPNYWTTAGVVQSWGSEGASYDYGRNTCAPGKQCGHYTQIVWRNTTQVGCAMKRCNENSPFGGFPQWDFFVCNYAPPGNFVGQRPY